MGKKSKRANKASKGGGKAPKGLAESRRSQLQAEDLPSGYEIAVQVQERALLGDEEISDVVADILPNEVGSPMSKALTDAFQRSATKFDVEAMYARLLAMGMEPHVIVKMRKAMLEKPDCSIGEVATLINRMAQELDDEEDRTRSLVGKLCCDYLNVVDTNDINAAGEIVLDGLDIPREKLSLCEHGDDYHLVFIFWLGKVLQRCFDPGNTCSEFENQARARTEMISNSADEPMLARTFAMLVRASFTAGNPTAEANYARRALVFASRIPKDMGSEPVVLPCRQGDPDGNSVAVNVDVRSYLPNFLKKAEERLEILQGPPKLASGTFPFLYTAAVSKVPILCTILDYKISTGGNYCDCCGKTPGDAGMVVLQKCKRCRLAFYCSEECQSRSWYELGHMHHCKKWGRFEKNDEVLLHGLRGRPELNDEIFRVVEKLTAARDAKGGNTCTSRWKVVRRGLWGKDLVLSVKKENLRHPRPIG